MVLIRSRRSYRKKGSRYKSRTRAVTRASSNFGSIRSTRGVARMRLASRRFRAALNPFPNTKLVRHKYCDTVQLPSGTAGQVVSYIFRANSLYDPDFTGVGHQPMFHDQMSAQYNYYTVLSSRITFSFPPAGDTQSKWLAFCDDDTSINSGYNNLEENHWVRGPLRLDRMNGPLVLKAWYDAAKWNKTTRSGLMADDNQKVATGSNPPFASAKYFVVARTPMSATDGLPATNMYVTIYYTALWREPVDHIGS